MQKWAGVLGDSTDCTQSPKLSIGGLDPPTQALGVQRLIKVNPVWILFLDQGQFPTPWPMLMLDSR